MMASLVFLLFGNTGVVPVLAAAELVMAAGVLVFAVNLYRSVDAAPAHSPRA